MNVKEKDCAKKGDKYWIDKFSEGLAIMNMPFDRYRSESKKMGMGLVEKTIDTKVSESVKKISSLHNVSDKTIMATVFAILLNKYTSEDEIIFGSSPNSYIENKSDEKVTNIIIKSQFNESLSFSEALDEMENEIDASYANRDFSIETLADILAIDNDKSRNLMYDIQFNCIADNGHDSFENSLLDIDMVITNLYDIEHISIRYSKDLYDRDTIERFAERYVYILEQVTKDMNILLRDITIASEKEIEFIENNFNNTEVEISKTDTVVTLINEKANRYKDNFAVILNEDKITYENFKNRSNILSKMMKDIGIEKGDKVAILLNDSVDMITSIFAIMQMGAVYLPIDKSYPVDRIEYMLKDSKSKLLISDSKLTDLVTMSIEKLVLDKDVDFNVTSDLVFNNLVSQSDDAYIIYTSGTTGKPKGVVVQHRSLLNLCLWYKKFFSLTNEDQTTKFAGFAFDVSVWEIFPCLISGASLHIIDEEIKLDIEKLNEYYHTNNISIAFLPTQFCEQFIKVKNTSLRYLNTGGEKLKNAIKHPESTYKFMNNYGPTETTVICSSYEVENKFVENISIGKPIANTKAYIINKSGNLQAVGVFGELNIAGEGLAKGYLNRKDLTDEKFVFNKNLNGQRLYRTGDLARWLSNGNLEFGGRIDHQVKIRGYRIELGEIENVLSKHEFIDEATIKVVEDASGDLSLNAYYVSDEEITTKEIKMHLKKDLPEYMIPSMYMKLEKMPLTSNGKVDKRKLPQIETSSDQLTFEKPLGIVEIKLADIWSDILGIDNKIDRNSNFFEIGGHSLKATILVGKIRSVFKINIKLKDIFSYPKLEKLAELIENSKEELENTIEKVVDRNYYDVSSAQERIYVLSEKYDNSTIYNIPMEFFLRDNVDTIKLESAIKSLIDRHKSLQTSFDYIDGKLVQVIDNHSSQRFRLNLKDVDLLSDESIKGEFIKPFDLAKSPLMRCELRKDKSGSQVLLIDMHHIISDGTSVNIFMNELLDIYNGNTLDPLNIDYKDYANWQKKFIETKEFADQKEFWLDKLGKELPVLNLPTDRIRPVNQSYEGKNLEYRLSDELTRKIKKASLKNNVTLYMFLSAAYSTLLYKYTAEEDIVYGSPVAGRIQSDTQSIIGMFINTLVMRSRPVGEKTFNELLLEVRDDALKSFSNQEINFDYLVQMLDIKNDTSRSPIFDTFFSLQNMDMNFSSSDIIQSMREINTGSKFDLSLLLTENKNNLDINLEYSSALFDESSMMDFIYRYEMILESVVDNLDIELKNINILRESEWIKIRDDFNNTDYKLHDTNTVIDMFENVAEMNPSKLAVVLGDERISYKKLKESSDLLVERMISMGIKKHDIVAVMFGDNLHMITAILAVIKLGATYMPIDKSYPTDRIEFMLEDSNSKLLITDTKSKKYLNCEVNILNLDYDIDLSKIAKLRYKSSVKQSDNAYIIYTSGTTGKPKGVIVNHRSLLNLCMWHIESYNFTIDDNTTKFAGFGFDVSVWEIFPSLVTGSTLHIIEEAIKLDVEEVNKYYNTNNITVSFLPTQYCEQFLEVKNTSLRCLLAGGDKLKKGVNKGLNTYKLFNNYGPTECTVVSTYYEVEEEKMQNIPIGKPVPNAKAFIMDKYDRVQAIGIFGELYMAGTGVAVGYLNRDELTKAKFIDSPYYDASKLYKTGDIARWLPDGNIEFIGRADHQVKIRGFRIELGEIENVILSFKGITDSLVKVFKDSNEDLYLGAYFTANCDIDKRELKNYIKGELPLYMLPSAFMELDKFPLTPNGKIDKNKLPEIILSHEEEASEKPLGKIEVEIAKTWSVVLGKSNVIGRDSNFFELGGHSLKAVSVVAILKKEYNISVNDIFSYPTIRGLASLIEHRIASCVGEKENEVAMKNETDYKFVKVNADSAYEDEIKTYKGIDLSVEYDYKDVFLCGATGFLGIYLFRDLLVKTTSNVHILVRGKNSFNCLEKFKQKLEYYFDSGFYKLYENRIFIYKGDLGESNLGLDDMNYQMLSKRIDCIINSAANVSHYGKYEEFKDVNVDGVNRIIEFAKFNKKKSVVHISTVSVASGCLDGIGQIEFTENQMDIGQKSSNVYAQTKLEAEKIVASSIEDGIDCRIFRMGNIMFDSKTGRFQENIDSNAFYSLVKSVVALEYVPKDYFNVDFTFVDYASDAILKLFKKKRLSNQTFHIVNNKPIELEKAFDIIDYNIEKLEAREFEQEVMTLKNSYLDEYKEKLMLHFGMLDDKKDNMTKFDIRSDKTNEILKRLDFNWPELDRGKIENAVQHCKLVNFIE